MWQLFFEGVEGLLAGGTKADEVGFRLDYSKTELKKCIREYPGKEVCVCVCVCVQHESCVNYCCR